MKFILVFMLSTSILIPSAAAWSLQTHQDIASKAYHSLPSNVQQKLDLNEMKKGSIAPDVVFKDNNPNHKYPASVTQSKKWLNKGKKAYKSKNYKYASYCYGVASHYTSDTYSAPHSAKGVTKAQHKAYENQATGMTPSITSKGGSLKQGQSSWKNWMKTKNPSIAQKDLNNAGSAVYSQIKNSI